MTLARRYSRSVILVALLLTIAASCGDSSGPAGACLDGIEGLELTVTPVAGSGPEIEWQSDGCVAVGLLVQEYGIVSIPWAIRLANQAWGSRPGLPTSITYGVVPAGAFQTEPEEGPALELTSGREYVVILTTRSGDQGVYNSWLAYFVQP